MPADANNLTCGYFFTDNNNNNSKSTSKSTGKGSSAKPNSLKATTNEKQLASSSVTASTRLLTLETGNNKNTSLNSTTQLTTSSNKGQKVRIGMELYKAKPQYLSSCSYKTVAGHAGPSSAASASASAPSLGSNSNSNKWPVVDQLDQLDQLDSSLHQWSKIKKIGSGLYNLGNNCYLNATLQCMAYTPSLSQWLVARPHSPVCKVRPLKGFCTLCEVEKIIHDMFNSCGEYAKPNSLCFNIKSEFPARLADRRLFIESNTSVCFICFVGVSNVFGVGTQEDASEFFTTLLESMTKAIKFPPNAPASPSPLKSNILDDIFSFQFRSRSKYNSPMLCPSL